MPANIMRYALATLAPHNLAEGPTQGVHVVRGIVTLNVFDFAKFSLYVTELHRITAISPAPAAAGQSPHHRYFD
jgi:hypothetical protein